MSWNIALAGRTRTELKKKLRAVKDDALPKTVKNLALDAIDQLPELKGAVFEVAIGGHIADPFIRGTSSIRIDVRNRVD